MNINETHDIHRVCLSLLTLWVTITWIGLHCDLIIVFEVSNDDQLQCAYLLVTFYSQVCCSLQIESITDMFLLRFIVLYVCMLYVVKNSELSLADSRSCDQQ